MKEKKQNKKIIIIIISVASILLIIAAVIGIFIIKGFFSREEPERGEGVVGIIVDDWETGIEETNTDKPKGTQIPGYSSAEMNEGDTSLHLSIGNPKENEVGFIATLKLSDGTVLFTSELLRPGQGLKEIPLSQTLKKGTYDAVVYYQCVSLNDGTTPLNSAESQFKLVVK